MAKTDSVNVLSNDGVADTQLVCMFCVTAGQNGESLGSDEQPIIEMIFLLYDITNNKVTAVQQHYVRPIADDISETTLTADCKLQTGLQEDDLKNAQPLENVLEEFERFLKSKEIHPHQGGRSFCLCTDGPLHLRLCLHPEAFRKNITLAPHLYRYYDLRKAFRQFYKVDKLIISTRDMLEFLSIEADQNKEFGMRHSQDMAKIISRLVTDGYQFRDPEIIIDKLESGICGRADSIDDETVVKARGLPWQSSDQDIFNFFRGLNVAKGGVAVCLSQQGRRNGEAMVRFESREHRVLALRKHKHHLGQRYIEVYRATGKDFIQVAAGSSREAQLFLSRQSQGGGQVIVRMRGLPYTAKSEQVIEFFKTGEPSVDVLDEEEGILFVHQADGRATGDAFVLFATETDAAAALTKHKQLMGTRYIELFKSTTAEVQQVLNRSMDPRNPVTDNLRDLHAFKVAHIYHPLSPMTVPMQTLLRPMTAATAAGPLMQHQLQQQLNVLSGTGRKDCIRLRGLPAETSVNDIVAFLDRLSRDIVNQGVHLIYTSEGLPSGEAFIQMTSEEAAEGAMLTKSRKMIYVGNKRRSIEVIQCSSDSLNSLLSGGQTPPPFTLPPISIQHVATSLPSGAVNQWLGLPHGVSNLQTQQQQPALVTNALSTMLPQILPVMDASNLVKHSIQDGGLLSYNNNSQQLLLTQQQPQQQFQLQQQQSCLLPAGASVGAAVTVAAGSLQHQQQLVALSSQLANNSASILSVPTSTFPHVQADTVQPSYLSVNGAATLPFSNGLATANNASNTQFLALQPVFYWASPTPPISPNSPYYIQPSPVSILVKGLPPTIQASDILSFLKGLYEIQPDIQVQRGIDGRPTGDAIVTFATRAEADRAVMERNRKMLGNRLIELHAT